MIVKRVVEWIDELEKEIIVLCKNPLVRYDGDLGIAVRSTIADRHIIIKRLKEIIKEFVM